MCGRGLVEISIILAIRFWPRTLGARDGKGERKRRGKNRKRPQGRAKSGAKYSPVTLFHLQFRGKMQMVALFSAGGKGRRDARLKYRNGVLYLGR